MEEQKNPSVSDSSEDHSYGNGPTQPPKSYGWVIALVLSCCILLVGIVSAFRLWNLQRFVAEKTIGPVSFMDSAATTSPTQESVTQESIPLPTGDANLQLNPSPTDELQSPQGGLLSLQEIYAKSIPSVVSIACSWDGGSSSGTGVVLTQTGYLVTNAHVVENAQKIQVLLTDGRTMKATVVGSDSLTDLAVLYIPAQDLTPAEFGDSTQLLVGDDVVAIGDPLGIVLRGTMTDGIISAINRNITSGGRTMTLIQTNAALNSGNSGGPLINRFGQVIGINTMKIGAFSDSAGVEGLGFAIPSVTVKEIVDQLISQGYVSGRPALPLEGEWVSFFQQQFRRLPAGLYITHTPNHATIQAKDIVIRVDGQRVTSPEELEQVLYSHQVGDEVELVIYRNGNQLTTTILLTEDRKQG